MKIKLVLVSVRHSGGRRTSAFYMLPVGIDGKVRVTPEVFDDLDVRPHETIQIGG